MITYRYSLIEDIKSHFSVLWSFRMLKKNKIVVFYFNPLETLKLILKYPVVDYQCDKDINCYWVSGGTWGSYYPPNKIHICPREATSNFLKKVISHEIVHLEYEKDVKDMSHRQKEAYIEKMAINSKRQLPGKK